MSTKNNLIELTPQQQKELITFNRKLLETLIEANSVIEERVGESDGTREIRKLIKKTKKLHVEGK